MTIKEKRKDLKKRIAEQKDYIHELNKRDFDTPDRRIEVTNSAFQVLKRLKNELENEEDKDIWTNLLGTFVLSAVASLISYFSLAFMLWSWNIGSVGFGIVRLVAIAVLLVGGYVAFKSWIDAEDEE